MSRIVIADIQTLSVEVELPIWSGTAWVKAPNGQAIVKTYDPLVVGARLQRKSIGSDGMIDTSYDLVREELGFPVQADFDAAMAKYQAEIEAASPETKAAVKPPYTLAPKDCKAIAKAMMDIVNENEATPKKE